MAGFISLADSKAHLRVLHDEEDATIQSLIDAASELIELETGYVAEEREEEFAFDRFDRVLELRKRPVMLADGDCFYAEDIVAKYRAICNEVGRRARDIQATERSRGPRCACGLRSA